SGVFGVGGGFLIVPVLHIGMGLPIQMAVGSAACQVLGPATTSLVARRFSREDLRLPLIVAGGITIGVYAGATLLHVLTSDAVPQPGSRGSNAGNLLVLSVYLPLLLTLGGFSLWEAQRELDQRPIRSGWIARWPIPPTARLTAFTQGPVSIPVLSWFGLGVGFLSGLLGFSGGLLLLPGLIYLLGLSWRAAVANSMAIVWLIAVQSTIAHAWHEHVQLLVVAGLLLGGTFGARLGVHFSAEVTPVRGRRSFGWLALATAAVITLKLGMLLNSPDP
ncbi:MAG: TSUP family transporter, partial [Planctomycetaceae bacterium]